MKIDRNFKYDHTALDSIVQRMARRRWLQGTAIVDPDGFNLEYTEKGLAVLEPLAALCAVWSDKTKGFWRRNLAMAHFRWGILAAMWQLSPPQWSSQECGCFTLLVTHFAWTRAHPEAEA